MTTLIKVVLLLCVHCLGQSHAIAAEERSAPWVRIYSEYVHDIYLEPNPAQIDKRVHPDNVLIAISNKNVYSIESIAPQIKLINYVTNKLENGPGCIVHPNDHSPATDKCGQLRLKALEKFPMENQSCKLAETPAYTTRIFIDGNIAHVRCLGKSTDADRYVYSTQTNDWIRQHIDLSTRNAERSGIPSEFVMGQVAYLGLESNRLFGCFDYGVPVTYREKKVPKQEATKPRPRYDDSFYRMPPTWQYQYLIKTKGFVYYCEQGTRLIDEPVEYGVTLVDGTALLRGNVSVLRIRTNNGSTEAPGALVKRVAPILTRQRLIAAIGAEALVANPDICNPSISSKCPLNILGGWKGGEKFEISRYFIQGIDHVIQSFFSQP